MIYYYTIFQKPLAYRNLNYKKVDRDQFNVKEI